MIYKLSDLQRVARKNGFAIPHVLGGNLEMTFGAIKAAEEMNSPIAIGLAPEVFSSVPMDITLPMILNIADKSKIPTAVQLEHGKSYDQIASAIKLGVNSVMFDGSDLSYEENILRTKDIVRMAHSFGACVEAELGCVGGSAVRGKIDKSNSQKTDPDTIGDFIEKTEVDSLAISFGNVHGHYRGPVDIDTDLVKKIANITDVPLVMHGGSGLDDAIYPKIVEAGISNIHFYSGIVKFVWEDLKRNIGEEDLYPPYHEIVSHTIDFFIRNTKKIIVLLGSEDKAALFSELSN